MSRREQIIDAVLQVFTQKGFTADFTMSSLAKRIDIGKSTLYEYFENKDDIIKEAILKYLDDRFSDVEELFYLETSSFEEGFKKKLKELLLVANQSRTLVETLSPGFFKRLPDAVQDEVRAKVESARTALQKGFIGIFMKAAQEGRISSEISIEKSMVVTSTVIGSIILYSDSRTEVNLDSFVDAIYESVIKILS